MSQRGRSSSCWRMWVEAEWVLEDFEARAAAMVPGEYFSFRLAPDRGFGNWLLLFFPKGNGGPGPGNTEVELVNELECRMDGVRVEVKLDLHDKKAFESSHQNQSSGAKQLLLQRDAWDFPSQENRSSRSQSGLFSLSLRMLQVSVATHGARCMFAHSQGNFVPKAAMGALWPDGSLRLKVKLAYENPVPFKLRDYLASGCEDLRLASSTDDGWHRLLYKYPLMLESEVFRTMLSTAVGRKAKKESGETTKESGKKALETLLLPDSPEILDALADYIQTGKTDLIFQRPVDLLELAERYQLQGLKLQAETMLAKRAKKGGLMDLYRLATTFNAAILKAEVARLVAAGEATEAEELCDAFPDLARAALRLCQPTNKRKLDMGNACTLNYR